MTLEHHIVLVVHLPLAHVPHGVLFHLVPEAVGERVIREHFKPPVYQQVLSADYLHGGAEPVRVVHSDVGQAVPHVRDQRPLKVVRQVLTRCLYRRAHDAHARVGFIHPPVGAGLGLDDPLKQVCQQPEQRQQVLPHQGADKVPDRYVQPVAARIFVIADAVEGEAAAGEIHRQIAPAPQVELFCDAEIPRRVVYEQVVQALVQHKL